MHHIFSAFIRFNLLMVAFLGLSETWSHAQGAFPVIPISARPIELFDLDRKKSKFQVTERGPNHRVWQMAETIKLEDGAKEEVVHSYTELASGLHFWDSKKEKWKDSKARIKSHRGGAVAEEGQQQVVFSNNINTLGAVDILAPDGVRLRASVIGLGYYDALSGRSVVLAELKDSKGKLVGEDQLLYEDAFDGVRADVLYTYSLTGLEQDVILRENPPAPSKFGLPDLTSRLEVITEWFDVPQPVKSSRVLERRVGDADLRSRMAEPDLLDEELSFGELSIGLGKAFWQSERDAASGGFQVPIGKQWKTLEGRTFLFESVDYDVVEPELRKLPGGRKRTALIGAKNGLTFVSLSPHGRRLPSTDFKTPTQEMVEVSHLGLSQEKGFVLDYSTYSGSFTDFKFKGDQTYYLSSTCVFNGKSTFYGGAVIKVAQGTWLTAWYQGPIEFKTSRYSPVIVTAKDDNSVGDTISGSTGSPGWYYGWSPFRLNWNAPAVVFENVFIRYAARPIYAGNGQSNRVRNVALLGGSKAITAEGGSSVALENVLIDDFDDAAFYADGSSSISGEHVTVHGSSRLGDTTGTALGLKNSIITRVGTIYGYTHRGQAHNVELANYSDAFKTVGAGRFYLKSGSPYRDFQQAADIDDDLHAELKQRTTYPPDTSQIYSGTSGNRTWGQMAPRDNDTLDLGYHYPPIDMAVYHHTIYGDGSRLTVGPGTVVAVAGYYGLRPFPGTTLNFSGHPQAPAVLTHFRTVQEQNQSWITGGSYTYMILPYYASTNCSNGADLNIRHSVVSAMAGYSMSIYSSTPPLHNILIEHSEFHGTRCFTYENCGRQTYRNNLFSDVYFFISGSDTSVYFNNNTFVNGAIGFDYWTTGPERRLVDNIFAGTWIQGSTTHQGVVTHSHNGYVNGTRPFPNPGPTDVILSGVYSWEKGPFGDYYHPADSPFIDAGSQQGGHAGLYHHTTSLTHTPEANGVVDMGYHYPALDVAGYLQDSDGDQIPDILEDLNGNGFQDPNEPNWGGPAAGNGGSGSGGGSQTPDLEVYTILNCKPPLNQDTRRT